MGSGKYYSKPHLSPEMTGGRGQRQCPETGLAHAIAQARATRTCAREGLPPALPEMAVGGLLKPSGPATAIKALPGP